MIMKLNDYILFEKILQGKNSEKIK